MRADNNNGDDFFKPFSGISPQDSRLLMGNPSARPIFLTIVVLMKVYPVLLLVLGSFGNLLSFCVLIRSNMRRYSTFCYLACLALVDIGVIMTFCFNFIPLYHFDTDIQQVPFACKLFAFSIYFLPQYSSWILVAVSIDRVISAKYLRLAKTWSKPRHSVLVTFVLGLFLGILNSHFFLYENNSLKRKNSLANNQTETVTNPTPETLSSQNSDSLRLFNNFALLGPFTDSPFTPGSFQQDTTLQPYLENSWTNFKSEPLTFDVNRIECSLENNVEWSGMYVYWMWTDLLVNVFLPFTAMIACTIMIILTLIRSSSRAGSTSARRSRRRRNISVMLITVNLVFIILTAPIVIFLSIYGNVKEEENYPLQATLILIKVFCIILMNLNHSVNIIIYSVTGKEFRVEMVHFLRTVGQCVFGKPIHPNDIAYLHHRHSFCSRLRRYQQNFFRCCRIKFSSNSSNATDSSGVQHTTASGLNHFNTNTTNSIRNNLIKKKPLDPNGKRKSSIICYPEPLGTRHASHRLTVQIQAEPVSSTYEREDLSLQRLSNSTED